jgi:multiple antibiotic resistance protein
MACVDWRTFGEAFVTMLVIMDPAGTAPVFVSLTSRMSAGDRQRAALRAVWAAGLLIVGFALVGEAVLSYLGVSIEALSIAGGLLLLLVALEMLRGFDAAPADVSDVALVPLATPLVAGPGAIATVIVLTRQGPDGAVIAGTVAALLTLGASLLLAGQLARLVPAAWLHFLTRVFGLLLAAIAVQLVIEGVVPLAR